MLDDDREAEDPTASAAMAKIASSARVPSEKFVPPDPIEDVANERECAGRLRSALVQGAATVKKSLRSAGWNSKFKRNTATNPTAQAANHCHWGRFGAKSSSTEKKIGVSLNCATRITQRLKSA